ncbi:MAG: DNA translocase FtsK 4TM domain-containing protein [Thioalkalispiraceae bacterium]|jgi:S-DNA-T family DNA segregation ATPase FtsK/SpoIIIE
MAQAKQKTDRPPLAEHLQRGLREGALFVFAFVAIYFLIAITSYAPQDPGWSTSARGGEVQNLGGLAGAWFADVVLALFGYLAYLIPLMVAYVGWLIYRQMPVKPSEWRSLALRGLGFIFTLASACGLASLYDNQTVSQLPQHVTAGGIFGDLVKNGMTYAFNQLGATLLLLAVFFSAFTLFTNFSWLKLMDITGAITLNSIGWIQTKLTAMLDRRQDTERQQQHLEKTKIKLEKQAQKKAERIPPRIEPVIREPKVSERAQKERQVPLFRTDGETELPPLALLDEQKEITNPIAKDALEAISRQVEIKLADFGIEVQVVAVHPGPVITRYELQPAAGVKVSQISNLAKDLARALSAISVRIVEVIPGKSTVGLEIPNEEREVVQLHDNLKSETFERAKSPLTLALGKDISGHPVIADLARMPHLLVAGTTGAGKSVALNAMLLSILYNAKPQDVRMILIDPKMLELSIYDGIPHLLSPVVTDMKDASNALRWCVAEMDRRYQLMAALKVRNISGFNKKVVEAKEKGEPILDPLHPQDSEEPAAELDKLPYIVVIVDELADMMMLVGKKVEQLIARLAQKARAAGVHLILATQRPSVDVLTGLIKANIPCRIAFQVSSKVDSRTILDQQGAESLLGHGDMLYLPAGTGVPVRVHGAFVSDNEVHRVVDYLKQSGEPQYEDDVLTGPSEPSQVMSLTGIDTEAKDDESDPLYDEAVKIVTETRRASISGVQRRLKIGYNRAARMVEAMEAAGVVGPQESNGNREVLAPPPPKD